jgi:hypothetical protein
MIKRVWNCESNSLRHVILDTKESHRVWDDRIIKYSLQKSKKLDPNNLMSERQRQVRHEGSYTISTHYLLKSGIYLKKNANPFIATCRKERHFLDFCK